MGIVIGVGLGVLIILIIEAVALFVIIIRWLEKELARLSHPLAPKCAASKRSIK